MKIRIESYSYLPDKKESFSFWQMIIVPTITISHYKWDSDEEDIDIHINSTTVLFEWLFWAIAIQFL